MKLLLEFTLYLSQDTSWPTKNSTKTRMTIQILVGNSSIIKKSSAGIQIILKDRYQQFEEITAVSKLQLTVDNNNNNFLEATFFSFTTHTRYIRDCLSFRPVLCIQYSCCSSFCRPFDPSMQMNSWIPNATDWLTPSTRLPNSVEINDAIRNDLKRHTDHR